MGEKSALIMRQRSPMTMAANALAKLTDDELKSIQFTMPWQMDEMAGTPVDSTADGDGFNEGGKVSREELQRACWDKFNLNPQVSTAVKGQVGRLAGFGFEISCDVPDIQEFLDEIDQDPRNRLYNFWPKYVARSIIEGELLLCLTVHNTGFIEVDFIDPSHIGGDGEDGIIYHPDKATMPLFYFIETENPNGGEKKKILVPSIFIARYPELVKIAAKQKGYKAELVASSKGTGSKFSKLGGFKRFIVSWDKGFMTKRNVGHLRTILEWLNHYENLKKYEIDHKKSAGSYLWVITMEDSKAFRSWISLSDSDRAKTGILAKKTPGGTLVMPPGMKVECMNPSLPTISESDTDIFHMITSGLNEPEDVTSGQSKGTFAAVKATRGPMADRISDEVSAFEKFLRFDFFGSIFFLKSVVSSFPTHFSQNVAVDFKDQEPVFKKVKKRPEQLIIISFPTSEMADSEAVARTYLGVKHGSTNETLGIPNEIIAKKLGFANYRRLRLKHATEAENYPALALSVDQAAIEAKGEKVADKNSDAKPVVNPTRPVLKKRVKKE